MLTTKKEGMSLLNIGEGAAAEKFDIELAKVIRNILDPNTGLEKRVITLKVSLEPDKRNQDIICTTVECVSKLGATKAFSTYAMIGIGPDGKPEAKEMMKQGRIPGIDNVVDINK